MSKKYIISSEVEELDWEELLQEDQELMVQAQEISKNAYAPYSDFQVGAAVRLKSGLILQSSNQENVSFPVGVCAERLVLGYAGANYPLDPVMKIAIVAKRKGEDSWASVSPCGMCRQAINETELRFNKLMEILILKADHKILKVQGIQALLPFKFDDLNS
ncbi:cytidine deaminase [Algoriphagus machipongonensis]|uniref:Cytidine deaminase n=1 Tax=Algoriphagus machipongonensis TaxID=388413 RepID=A3HXU1_9BACT|nr:cytidine deaminase [Algoriphagus machipongonensis]EAZ81414.1 cytidine deaminase [Algoriphagus machipongonensis]